MAGDNDASPLKCQTVQHDGVIEHICSTKTTPANGETGKQQPNVVAAVLLILAFVLVAVLIRKFISRKLATSKAGGTRKT